MKISIAISVFILLFSCHGYSQNIEVEKNLGGHVLFYNGKKLDKKMTDELLRTDRETFEHYSRYKNNAVLVNVFSALGGFALGWSAGRLLSGQKVDSIFIPIIGVSSMLGAILIGVRANKELDEAVKIFNQNQDKKLQRSSQ